MTRARILIIEDERIVARDIENRLTRLGYEVVGSARSGEEAVRLAEQLRPDLILMDIRLSGPLDGIAAAHEIRARLHLPVVYLTAYADEDTLWRARITEPFGYVLKPFDERELHTAVEMALYKHQAEERLRVSEERYRSIFDNAIEGIFQSNPAWQFLTANRALARMLGYGSPEELMTSIRDIPRQLWADPERHAEYARRLEERGLVQGFECQLLRKDGSKAWVSLWTRIVRDARGNVLFREGAVEEISERKHLEEQIRLAQKMEAIGQLAGGVAHDFNNLLTVINGCAAMLASNLHEDEASSELLADILKAGERAAALTRQLLVFSRRQALQPRVVNLNERLGELSQMLRWLIGERIELTVRTDPALGMVKLDPAQLEQVIMNLAINARDAMPHGGNLLIETRNVDLDVSYVQKHPELGEGRHAVLAVTDVGHGMDEATKARIFEPFFTTKPVGRGTGLGLSLIHGIVRHGGGSIEVASEVGHGSTFTIYLPIVEEVVRPETTPPDCFEIPNGTETVLLVDDDDAVRTIEARVLRSCGYTVLEARNGEEALQMARDHARPIDLLLTDVVMPGMSGRHLATLLSAARPALKSLFVSGYTAEDLGSPDVLQQADNYLPKPFTPMILACKVREILDTGPDSPRLH